VARPWQRVSGPVIIRLHQKCNPKKIQKQKPKKNTKKQKKNKKKNKKKNTTKKKVRQAHHKKCDSLMPCRKLVFNV
jgi:hypothetical protein